MPSPKKTLLLVVTSADRMGTSPHPTGYWLEEVVAPYYVFADAGYDVHIASPKGSSAPRDAESDKPEHRAEATARFEADSVAQSKLANTLLLAEVKPEDYAGVFFAGGHGTMTDFPSDSDVIRLVEQFYAADKPVASVCHGPACLVGAKRADGQPLISGKYFTCFTNAEEQAALADAYVPFLLQTTLETQGGIFSGGEMFAAKAVVDGMLVTGQNPASGAATAQIVLKLLG